MSDKNFKPEVTTVSPQGKKQYPDDIKKNVEEMEFTEEQNANQLRVNEEDFLQGLIEAAGYVEEEKKRIEIIRDGKLLFAFTIRPLSENEYSKCKKKHTKYVRNRSMGVKMPEDTDGVKYRADLIYNATIDEDREKLWDNKKVWTALRDKGMQIVTALDVIEYSLKAGEKDKIIEQIDKFSGYEDDNLEEVTKN